MVTNQYNAQFLQKFKRYHAPTGVNAYKTGPEIFLSYVKKTNSCWLWVGKTASNGYGMHIHKGKCHLAHRLSFVLHNKKNITNKLVCHKCDVRHCVNPAHLFIGDHKDNARDCIIKKRNNPAHGFKSGKTKFTILDVKTMFQMRNCGALYKTIAKKFKTYPNTVGRIVKGERWAVYTKELRKAKGVIKGSGER